VPAEYSATPDLSALATLLDACARQLDRAACSAPGSVETNH